MHIWWWKLGSKSKKWEICVFLVPFRPLYVRVIITFAQNVVTTATFDGESDAAFRFSIRAPVEAEIDEKWSNFAIYVYFVPVALIQFQRLFSACAFVHFGNALSVASLHVIMVFSGWATVFWVADSESALRNKIQALLQGQNDKLIPSCLLV